MEVTKENFEALLPEILDSIDKSCFVSIDCEFSGLTVNDEKINFFESVEERYHVLRESASQFQVFQFGLCPFFYDPEKDEFSYKVYNFYTFPRDVGKGSPNIRFLCESSSLEFLASSGFDFNKLIYKGIPYLTFSNEEKMRQYAAKRAIDLAVENSTPMSVPENLRKFMSETEEKIKRLKQSELKEVSLENLTNYQRKLIFQNIKPKYADCFLFETVLVEETNIRVLKISKMTPQDQSAREEEKMRAQMEEITKLVGFSHVIRRLSQSHKLIVGHNMLLDISHTIHQFVADLPPTLKEFKFLVQSTFPNLIDTKLMAASHPFRELVSSSVLQDLLKKTQEKDGGFPLPDIKNAGTPGQGYDIGNKKSEHEAGYDAYVTGLCFLGMTQHLGTLQNPKKSRVLPESPVVMPFLNKMFLMRMQDVTYLNISGTDLTPSRSHVFYVTCPSGASQKSIQNWFSSFGQIQFWWRDETSLFVTLNEKDQSPFVMDNIEGRSGYSVMPFENYQKQNQDQKADASTESRRIVAEKKRHLSESEIPSRPSSVIVDQDKEKLVVLRKTTTSAPTTPSGAEDLKNKRIKTDNNGSSKIQVGTEEMKELKQLFQEPTWI